MLPVTNLAVVHHNFSERNQPEPSVENTANDNINQNIFENNLLTELSSEAWKIDDLLFLDNNTNADDSRNLNRTVDLQEQLELHISVDEDNDNLHSWRPNLSSNLCADFFMPSLTTKNSETNSNQKLDLTVEQDKSQIVMNPEGLDQGSWNYGLPRQMFHGYLPKTENAFGINFENHLHFQKCHMNAIRYEVIKAKIELSEVLESVEKLSHELEEKSMLENEQDIDKLNAEIVELRLECQCLCSEVDFYTKDNSKALLGETDEGCFSRQNGSTKAESSTSVEKSGQPYENAQKSDSSEEVELWKCTKCTFDNHPDMNVCEMCQSKRSPSRKPSYSRSSSHENYRHPKKGSLPIKS